MSVFVILPRSPNATLDAKMKASFSETDIFQLNDRQWLVSAELTAKQVTEKLGILTDPQLHSIVVFSVSNYFGRYAPEVWEWLKLKMEKSPS